MNSELKEKLEKILKLRDRLESRIEELEERYHELRYKTDKSQEEFNEMNKTKKFYSALYEDLMTLKDNLEQINYINEDLKEAAKKYNDAIGTLLEQDLLEEHKKIFATLDKYISETYKDFEDLIDSNLDLPEKKKKKFLSKKTLGISACALALLIALGYGINKVSNININNSNKNPNGSSSNDDKNQDKLPTEEDKNKVNIPELDNEAFNELTKVESEEELSTKAENAFTVVNAISPDKYTIEEVTTYLRNKNNLGVTDTKTPNPDTSNPDSSNQNTPESDTKQEETLTFTDVFDEEQVAYQANDIINDLNTNAPGHNYTIEEIENMIRLVNNGVAEETTQDALLHNEIRIEGIWNKENGMEVDVPFDTSKFFKDGTLGQKLAKKIYEARVKIMNSVENDEEYRKAAEEFTVLFVNSWYLNGGNNEISVYEVETAYGRALLDSYFLNTYALIHIEDVKVIVNENEFTLREEAEKADFMSCGTKTVIADNGEEVEMPINKFTSDLLGAEMELTRIKEEKHTLSK